MKTTQNPVRTTIFFGLICGLAFIPLSLYSGYFIPWPKAYWMILCLYVAAYGFFLTRLSQKSPLRIFPSLLLLFPAVFLTSSTAIFLLIALGIFSWIRSGICFQPLQVKRLFSEISLSLGGGALVAGLTPVSAVTWALGIWLFFLVQALYFVWFEKTGDKMAEVEIDLFEKARMGAEKILSNP